MGRAAVHRIVVDRATDEIGRDQLAVRLGVCAIARQEAPYLLEWIAFHTVVGVERFIVYDNDEPGSEQSRLLQRLHDRGVVTRVPWRGEYARGPQIPAYADCLRRFGPAIEWLAIIDCDEFICPVRHRSIPAFLDSYRDASALAIPWLVFGSSGEQRASAAPVMVRFTRCQTPDPTGVWPTKSIVRTSKVRAVDLHVHELHDGEYLDPTGRAIDRVDATGMLMTGQLQRGVDVIRVNHYMTKSREEWCLKSARGRADRGWEDLRRRRADHDFAFWDLNDSKDMEILAYYSRTQREISRLAALVGQ